MSEGLQPQIIVDQEIPLIGGATTEANSGGSSTDDGSPATYKDRIIPRTIIAVDTISQSLDTQSRKIKGAYEFEQMGSIQIGTFVSGVSGFIQISPDGIIATDLNGNITFTLDGTTGNATFKGTVQAGAFIAGAVQVGGPNVIIDGSTGTIIINDGTYDRVLIGYGDF